MSDRRRARQIALALAGTAILLLAYAYFVEPYRLVIDRQEARIQGWDKEFDGFRVVLISDIHGGSRGGDAATIHRIVNSVNEQNVDAVFLLGDYVSTTSRGSEAKMPISEIAKLLGQLRARYGVYAVLGNHDGWFGDEKVASELTRAGISVLDGKLATIERNGRLLRILGLRDHLHAENWKSFSDEAKNIIADSEGKGNIVVLEHSPDVIEMVTGDLAISRRTKIMFAGHTHGGQVWLPIIGYPVIPSSYGQKYAAGHIRDRGIDLFVTTGTGTSILPFRFLVPPEIMVVTIVGT